MEFGISISGDKEVAAGLYKIGAKAEHAEPILDEIGGDILKLEKQRFAKGRFKPLAASTKRRKRREGINRRPLHGATGALEESLTHKHGPGNIYNVNDNSLTIGSRVYYAKFHQYGIGVPKREPLKIAPKDRKPIARKILDYLTGNNWHAG